MRISLYANVKIQTFLHNFFECLRVFTRMHIVRVSDRPSHRTSCPPVLTMGEHLPLAQVILNVQCVLYSVHTIQNKKIKCTESTTCPVLQSSQWMSTYPQQCIGQGICSIYVMHVTIMHITCSETRSKHSPYNAMGEQLSTYPQQWSKDVLNLCYMCLYITMKLDPITMICSCNQNRYYNLQCTKTCD